MGKMMQLEKNMKTKAFEKKKNQLQDKAKELETIEQNNKLEMDRLKELQNKAEEEKGKLEAQREEMLKLQTLAENETDEGKKRRMTVQIRQFANKFQSAERKVKRMEEEYNKS